MGNEPRNQEGVKWMENRIFPTIGDLLAMLGIFFATQIAVTMIAMLVLLFSGQGLVDLEPQAKGRFLALVSLASLTATAVIIWRYRRWRRAPKIHVSLGVKGLNPLLLGWCFLLMMATVVVLEPLYELLPVPNQDFGRGVWAFLAVVVIAPTLEEWVCRGQIYGSLRTRYGVVKSILWSALIFGLMHVQPVPVINAFVLGLVLAFIYHATNSLWASVLLHALNNATAYFLTLAGYGDSTFRSLFGDHATLYLLFYVGAVMLVIGSLVAIWRQLHRPTVEAIETTPAEPVEEAEPSVSEGAESPEKRAETQKIDPSM